MKNVKLSARMQAVANFVQPGTGVVDVGTDHGYIPIYLAKNKYPGAIYASDIREGPLSRAKEFAVKYNVADKIEFYLSDGLKFTDGKGISTVTIAGLGGENMVQILENAPWVHNDVHLILQPQSKIADLTNWLDNEGFAIDDAVLVKDAGRIYCVLSVKVGKSRAPFTCAEMYADRILMEKKDPLLGAYLENLIRKTEKELEGMKKSHVEPRIDELMHTELALKGFKKMLEETKIWQP